MLRTSLAWLVVVTLALITPLAAHAGSKLAAQPIADSPAGSTPATCVEVSTRVRYSLGYDHFVDLFSKCQDVATCQVATDVNPQPQKVVLSPGQKRSLLTMRGSPARTFTAQVKCSVPATNDER